MNFFSCSGVSFILSSGIARIVYPAISIVFGHLREVLAAFLTAIDFLLVGNSGTSEGLES